MYTRENAHFFSSPRLYRCSSAILNPIQLEISAEAVVGRVMAISCATVFLTDRQRQSITWRRLSPAQICRYGTALHHFPPGREGRKIPWASVLRKLASTVLKKKKNGETRKGVIDTAISPSVHLSEQSAWSTRSLEAPLDIQSALHGSHCKDVQFDCEVILLFTNLLLL